MCWTIPNMLTTGRVIAAPCVALAFGILDRPLADWVAFVLFFAAAVTDFFDGWLARRLNQTSEIGKMLDPIADKAMVIIALAAVVARPVPADGTGSADGIVGDTLGLAILLPAALIILREVMVSGLREYLGDVKLPVTRLAKWKTTVQMLAIGVLLAVPLVDIVGGTAGLPRDGDGVPAAQLAGSAGLALLWLAAALTLATGWDYFRKGLAYIRTREES